jgi:hypothetical protein
MAKQIEQTTRVPILILDDKKRPSAFLFGPGDAAKFAKDAMEIGDKVADAFAGETTLLVYVRDSYANEGKHVIEVTFENFTKNGIYIEGISVQIPKPDKKDPKKGILDASVSQKPLSRTFGEKPTPPPFRSLRVPPGQTRDILITCDLLDQKRFEEKPYLLAKVELSPLNEEAKLPAEFKFRIRWSKGDSAA